MNISKLQTILSMGADKKVLKSLNQIYKIMKEDENFSISNYIKLMLSIIKGEKIVKFEDKYVISPFLPPFLSEAFIQNIKATPSSQNMFTQQIHAKRSAPISMYLCLTQKCPNNCIYCSAKNRDGENELTTQEWIKVINDLQDMKTPIIGLTGGEPMLREDIFDIVRSIDKRSVSTLFTSGINLTLQKAKELKKSGLFSLGISLDSYDKDKHNKNRRSSSSFDYAISALQISRKAGLYTIAQTVILKDEVDEDKLFRLFKFAKENGAHEVKILEPILSGELLNSEDIKGIFYDNSTRRKLIDIQHKANKKKKFPKITTFAYTESEERYGCGAGTQHSYISASGHLYPCDFVPMDFGSVRDESISKLWVEMNKIIGNPKIGCFAQRVNTQVYKKSNGRLPLNKNQSIEICSKNKSQKLPKYYRNLQKNI